MINVTSCVQSILAADRLLRTRPTYNKSVMVSVGVSALGRTNIHFVDPSVKVNGQYYRDILLTRDLLPDIKQYSDYFTFQQDGTPAHRARETVELLKVETPDFIPPNLWPPTAPISTQWITHSGAYCKNGFTRQTVRMSTSYDAGLLRNGTSLTSA